MILSEKIRKRKYNNKCKMYSGSHLKYDIHMKLSWIPYYHVFTIYCYMFKLLLKDSWPKW